MTDCRRLPLVMAAAALVSMMSGGAGAMAADCAAKASRPWAQAGNGLVLEAVASGARCAKAAVALTIRSGSGKVLFTFKSTADTNLAFAEVKQKAEMQQALGKWLEDATTMLPTSDKLPAWKAGAEQPDAGEFSFYVEEGMTQPVYAGLRAAKRPMICFVQGMESMGCVVERTDGAVVKVGVQTFPG